MKILITNDDGIQSPGLFALAKSFARWGTVVIVAPEKERSTTGHSLTLHKPLRLHKVAKNAYSVSGGPADCLHIAMSEIFGKRPDFVISGINSGSNMGQDVFYSGTVSAAREAAIQGIPSMAISLSLCGRKKKEVYFDAAAKVSADILKQTLKYFGSSKSLDKCVKSWPRGVVLNVNVPNIPLAKIKGFKMARQGERVYSGEIVKRKDNRGRNYYWIGGTYVGFKPIKNTDCQVVSENFVSITPLQLDTTDHLLLDHMRGVFVD